MKEKDKDERKEGERESEKAWMDREKRGIRE